MNEEEKKKLDEAMKIIYGSNRPVPQRKEEESPVAKIEEELESISNLAEKTKEKMAAIDSDMEEVEGEIKEVKEDLTEIKEKEEEAKSIMGKPKEENKPSSEIPKSNIIVSANPHIKDKITVNSIMWNVVIALLPATVAGIYFFKAKAATIILASIITAIFCEFLVLKLTKKEITCFDGSAMITGLLFALVIPPTVPVWMAVIGSAFSILIGKQIFGGLGHNIFNPALIGRAFLSASFPAFLTRYLTVDGISGATPLAMLKLEGTKTALMTMFLGDHAGSIGETSALALLIGAAYLIYKKIIDWKIPAAYIGTVFIFALIFKQDPLFHILAGGLIIGAFFMATDYVTSPISKNGKLIFGIGCGFLTIIFRLFSTYPEGVMFSILLMNAATPLIDRFTVPKPFGFKKKKLS